MDYLLLNTSGKSVNISVTISGSKSESNRLLILQQLFPSLHIKNLSTSDDTNYLQKALSTSHNTINVGHAGTTMRFLTAFFATQSGKEVVLEGSDRLHNRPIKILVDALLSLGADITYLEKKGFPPLKIKGKALVKNEVEMMGNVSSQFISALLLVASSLPSGLTLNLKGELTSIPYVKMTVQLLKEIGIDVCFNQKDKIVVKPIHTITAKTVVVESDWSSASYWFSFVALSEIGSTVTLLSYKKNSLQGDSCLVEIYEHFGVRTTFLENSIVLKKENQAKTEPLILDLNDAPDIAQTIVVTCFGLSIECKLSGLHTLKIKETDRLKALQSELTKLGAIISVTDSSLYLQSSHKIHHNIQIATYNDHRMAMAFAPLCLKVPLIIQNIEVVSKSYPNFWTDLKAAGVAIEVK